MFRRTRMHMHTLVHARTQLVHARTHAHTNTYTSTSAKDIASLRSGCCNALQRTATHCNTLQHIATHPNTPYPRKGHSSISGMMQMSLRHQDIALQYTLQHTSTHCNTPHLSQKHSLVSGMMQMCWHHPRDRLVNARCNALKQIATNCNSLQHTTPEQRTWSHSLRNADLFVSPKIAL